MLDSNGNALPDSATSWVMVRDNVTGLIWEVKTNMDGVKNYNDPHDADNTYTWYDPNPLTNGGNAGTPANGKDTADFLDALNNARFGGNSDWRLPSIKELSYLVDYGIPYPGPTINTAFFPNTKATYYYWSSTTYAYYPDNAWQISFMSGTDGYDTKGSPYPHFVRAVRGRHFLNRFVDNGNGTITDTSSGLMWQKDTAEEGEGNYDTIIWGDALDNCEDLVLAGYWDWRLPNINELRSIVDYGMYNPSINTAYFPNTLLDVTYSSSTTKTSNPERAHMIDFHRGSYMDSYKTERCHVRAVRGGSGLIYISKGGSCTGLCLCFTTIGEGLDAATTLRIAAGEYTEPETINNGRIMVLEGGWDSGFATRGAGATVIDGILTIESGTIIVDGVVVQ